MEAFLRYWLPWPSVVHFIQTYRWTWPLCETLHFMGLILLIGGVGMFDLRILGVAKDVPMSALRRMLPWGVFGFALCVATGLVFVTGFQANLPINPYEVIAGDIWLQLKLVFILLAGVNLLAFYLTGMASAVDSLGAGADAPPLAKVIAGASLFLWLGVIFFGRAIPQAL